MEVTQVICINDGSEILIDGFDKISFSNNAFEKRLTNSGYTWQKTYPEILNEMVENKFIIIERNDEKDELTYRNHPFVYRNEINEQNKPLILTTNSITTIINI
ncbi:hypothetical protein [Atopobacter phocae]|uniref:hypothetical protein n=1 Tax=Atopobacter phocae TaxID=136492 RepID=UPI00046EE708|nr:hypothetical protein [Atopobacter phocae]